MSNKVIVREAQEGDIESVFDLMLQLAVFEGYEQEFALTPAILNQQLFKKARFQVLVAEHQQQITGILVYYQLPFTYDLKPWIYIKELIVAEPYRSLGIGGKLMRALAEKAQLTGVTKIRWDVLSSNIKAKAFYQSLGAKEESQWDLYSLTKDAIENLAIPV